jgi:hypothetical protein
LSQKRAFQNFKFEESVKFSRISGDESILTPLLKEGTNPKQDKDIILDFVSQPSVKVQISIEYCNMPLNTDNVPLWLKEELLRNFYAADKIPFISKPEETVAPVIPKIEVQVAPAVLN